MRLQTMVRQLGAVVLILALPGLLHAGSQEYGKAGPWTIHRHVDGGEVACWATLNTDPNTSLIFDYTMEVTSLGFSAPRIGAIGLGYEVEVWFDNNRADSQVLTMPLEGEMLVYRSPNNEPDGIFDSFANRSKISFNFLAQGWGELTTTFSLRGSNQMVDRTIACVQDARAPAASSLEWVGFRPGKYGPHLVSAGATPDGWPVYVPTAWCRAAFIPAPSIPARAMLA
ncbi:hypothetical protein ACUN0C_15700 [Faunimonas sp. B44]|uniref:hypothetical protein n=1 Tax=Faunimonas sp. B44 TaxID=3461493 RepID=UPI0040448567